MAQRAVSAWCSSATQRTEDRAPLVDARADHIIERIDEALALL